MRTPFHFIILSIALLFSTPARVDAKDASSEVPQESIQAFTSTLESMDIKLSSVRKRRAHKEFLRDLDKLLKKHPDAKNRYEVLYLSLKSKIQLLSLDKSDRTRKDLFETCTELSKAPVEFSNLRLDADLLLLERDMAQAKASMEERAKGMAQIIEQYRDSNAELKSLKTAVSMMDQLLLFEDKNHYLKRIRQRFPDHHEAIAYLQKESTTDRLNVVFSGHFDRDDGPMIHFPHDRMGHPYIAVFWSREDFNHKKLLSDIKNEQQLMPERFEVYSFNLDELPDSGASIIHEIGLDCTVMKLPQGIRNKTFITYATTSPSAIIINEYGRVILKPNQNNLSHHQDANKKTAPKDFTYPRPVPSQPRFRMQVQSLFNGDFLVQPNQHWFKHLNDTEINQRQNITSLLPQVPFRYRLSQQEAKDNYSNLLSLSSQSSQENVDQQQGSWIKSIKIISLLGMWGHTNLPKYLDAAKIEADSILQNDDSKEAKLVARFCLAKIALREGQLSQKEIIDSFAQQSKKDQDSPTVNATALVLSLIANNVDLYEHHRKLFLESEAKEPYAVLSFVRNRRHQHYLFQGNKNYLSLNNTYKRIERRFIINHDITSLTTPFPRSKFIRLNGEEMVFPSPNEDKITAVLFLEPPANGNLILKPSIYKAPKAVPLESSPTQHKKKKKKKPKPQPTGSGVIHQFSLLTKEHVNQGAKILLVFLGTDLEQIKALHEAYDFPAEVVMAPSGLKNPIVRSLDLFSADNFPNTFLVRRDGTIAWSTTGLPFLVEPDKLFYQSYLAMRHHINRIDLEDGLKALGNKNYDRAATLFSGPYHSEIDINNLNSWRQRNGKTEMHKWTASQHYGKALAFVGLKQWEKALEFIEKANLHHLVYFRHDPKRPCQTEKQLNQLHATILEKLGRTTEARSAQSKASLPLTSYPTNFLDIQGYDQPYEVFNDKMNQLHIGKSQE